MLLVNIQTLSDSELRYIAKQENIEDWENLSREDIIDELREIYGDEDAESDTGNLSAGKYRKTLTDISSESSFQLPGVEPLPESYNETYINIVERDRNWIYVFWSVACQRMQEIKESGAFNFLLRTEAKIAGHDTNIFDIDVSESDTCWNIELPWPDCVYKVSLICHNSDGDIVLCESNEVKTVSSYYERNRKELCDEKSYHLLIEPLISKSGRIIDNRQIKEIISGAFGGVLLQ